MDHPPPCHGSHHPSPQAPPHERCVLSLRSEFFRRNCPLHVRIDNGYIRRRAGAQCAQGSVLADHPRWIGRQPRDEGKQVYPAFVEEGQNGGKGGFESADAEGGLIEGAGLFLGGVGGMIGGDRIDRAAAQGDNQGIHITSGPQRGIDLGRGALRKRCLLGEGQVMGSDLGGDRYAMPFGLLDQIR